MELEDDILPSLEENSRPDFTRPDFSTSKADTDNKLKKLFTKRTKDKNPKNDFDEEIQVKKLIQ